jgi:hypothetical protein
MLVSWYLPHPMPLLQVLRLEPHVVVSNHTAVPLQLLQCRPMLAPEVLSSGKPTAPFLIPCWRTLSSSALPWFEMSEAGSGMYWLPGQPASGAPAGGSGSD